MLACRIRRTLSSDLAFAVQNAGGFVLIVTIGKGCLWDSPFLFAMINKEDCSLGRKEIVFSQSMPLKEPEMVKGLIYSILSALGLGTLAIFLRSALVWGWSRWN